MRKIKVGARRVWLRRDLRRAPPVQAQKFVIGRDELDLSQDHQLSAIPYRQTFRPKSERPRDDTYRRQRIGRISATDSPRSLHPGSSFTQKHKTNPSQANCRSPTEIRFDSMEHNQSHLDRKSTRLNSSHI